MITLALVAVVFAQARVPFDSTLALATFDSAWTLVRNTHYDPTMRGLDWNAVRTELRPKAARAANIGELRLVLTDMVDRLGESHYGIVAAEAMDEMAAAPGDAPSAGGRGVPGNVGVQVRLVDGRFVLSQVERDGPAWRAGLRPGDQVDRVGTRDLDRYARAVERATEPRQRSVTTLRVTMLAQQLLDGDSGSTVAVGARDARGASQSVSLVRQRAPGEVVRFGNLPGMLTQLSFERRPDANGCVGVIRFTVWMTSVAPRFDEAMRSLRQCRGIVIDLRGNPGGVAGMLMGISGYFLDTAVALGRMRTRTGELRFVANPRRVDGLGEAVTPYAGPLAILVDPLSASTTEFFAAGLQHLGRARIVGDTTAGQALPAVLTRLPSRDALLHAIADYTLPDGSRVEGRGVIPDVIAKPTLVGLRAGRDEAMERALAYVTDRQSRP
jgi:carboxyl-terminal processing protease